MVVFHPAGQPQVSGDSRAKVTISDTLHAAEDGYFNRDSF
jgi:hypothetical protein